MIRIRWLARPLLVAIVVMATLAVSTRQTYADRRDFTLINASNVTIIHVFVSASSLDDWGDDLLGLDVLLPGESVRILFSRFDGEAGNCLYDIKVIGENGEEGILFAVNLCEIATVTFS